MSSTKLRRTLALALAGGSLAIGVPAALAASGGGDAPASTGGASAPTFIQDEQQQDRARPDRGDCPEHDGGGQSGSGGESGSAGQGGTTEAPSL